MGTLRDSTQILEATLKTTPTVVNWVAAISFALLLSKILWLNAIPELFRHGYDLGQLTENILAATLAAYVFFLISYQLPQTLERRAVGPSIAMLAERVVQSLVNVLFMLNHYVNAIDGKAILPQPVTVDVVRQVFSAIEPNVLSIHRDPLGRPMTWFTYMIDESAKCVDAIDQVWRYARFIDAELAKRLDDIRLSQHAATMMRMKEQQDGVMGGGTFTLGNPDLSALAQTYFLCYQEALRLQEYCAAFRKLYGIT